DAGHGTRVVSAGQHTVHPVCLLSHRIRSALDDRVDSRVDGVEAPQRCVRYLTGRCFARSYEASDFACRQLPEFTHRVAPSTKTLLAWLRHFVTSRVETFRRSSGRRVASKGSAARKPRAHIPLYGVAVATRRRLGDTCLNAARLSPLFNIRLTNAQKENISFPGWPRACKGLRAMEMRIVQANETVESVAA